MSGVDIDGREIRKGALEAISRLSNGRGNIIPEVLQTCVREISNAGGTPLLVAENGRVLGAIALTDIVKGGMKERFDHLRAMAFEP
jgi:potassium-transporting ATPase ATP-binding subunit